MRMRLINEKLKGICDTKGNSCSWNPVTTSIIAEKESLAFKLKEITQLYHQDWEAPNKHQTCWECHLLKKSHNSENHRNIWERRRWWQHNFGIRKSRDVATALSPLSSEEIREEVQTHYLSWMAGQRAICRTCSVLLKLWLMLNN